MRRVSSCWLLLACLGSLAAGAQPGLLEPVSKGSEREEILKHELDTVESTALLEVAEKEGQQIFVTVPLAIFTAIYNGFVAKEAVVKHYNHEERTKLFKEKLSLLLDYSYVLRSSPTISSPDTISLLVSWTELALCC
jgi:hypothetical protein